MTDLAALSATEFRAFLNEVDRRASSESNETFGMMVGSFIGLYVKAGHRARAADAAMAVLDDPRISKRLWNAFVNGMELWADARDVRIVANTVERVAEIKQRHPMPVDYGIAKLLQSAYMSARREGRAADVEQLRAIGVARLEKALPDLVQRAHDDMILPQPGWGSMKMFAIYRSSLGEAFDQQLIEAFRRARLPLFRQLAIIERMEWIQSSAPLAEYLASLLSGRGEFRLSPAERATAERLRQKLAGTRTDHAAATPSSLPVGAGPSPVAGAEPASTSPGSDAPQTPVATTTTTTTYWPIAIPVALAAISAVFAWARRNRRAARQIRR